MKFSIIHPTARLTIGFSNPWWLAGSCARENCDHPEDCEYILVVHCSRGWVGLLTGNTRFGRFTVVTNYGRDCLVDQCNAGLLAASGEIVMANQDDMRYPPHWDTEILKLLPDTSKAMCVQAHTDGSRKDLLTLPTIATRPLVEKIGMIPSEYESMFSDDEWSIKAHKFGGVIPSTLYFQHLHPVNKTAEPDEVYALENRPEAYKRGWEVFQARKAEGFPRVPFPGEKRGEPEPGSFPAGLSSPPDYPILAMLLPGDNFSFLWVEGFMRLGAQLKDEGYIVKRFMAHSSNVYHTRMNLAEKCIEDARITGERPKYVLWIDSDNILLPNQLSGLIKFLDHYQQVDGISGWCWIRKEHGWTTSAGFFWEEDGVHLAHMNLDALFAGETDAEKFGPKRIEHSGFPCFLMRYEVLEQLGAAAFRPMTKADLPAYFDGEMPQREVTDEWFCGEDTAFCLRAKKAGFTFVVDPGCKVGHLKLQMQEPNIGGRMPMDTPQAERDRREGLNGPEIDAPPEYERIAM
jgi:GT2 family glycosyltransferase